ncbi:Uncharacterised protein [Amycolatopsis camponoti]|uniref:Uncharacterized protein n=1 Tax=Amycolatopsis camponoti TaxID=2606593 RepID=A0A6I8M6G3_9PSEU|nr:Uncharacterised protein [Amycolatopsis camponoti]
MGLTCATLRCAVRSLIFAAHRWPPLVPVSKKKYTPKALVDSWQTV